MVTFLSIVFWIAVGVGFFVLLIICVGNVFRVETRPDSIIFLTTDDDYRLALTRYRPSGPLADASPIILCSGGGLNSLIFDISKEISLAQFICQGGYDVWILDLRGRGFPFKRRLWGRRRVNWSFDDYVEFDLSAAVSEVCQRTGAEKVQWVGFGLGALVAFASLSHGISSQLSSIVALAAPVYFRKQQDIIGPSLLRKLSWVRLDILVKLFSPILGRWHPSLLGLLANHENIDGTIYRKAMINATSNFSRTELNQYAEWLEHDTFTAIVQRGDYRTRLAEEESPPILSIVGPRDKLAPVDMVEGTMNLLESAESKLVIASRMHGMSTNYGHLDLLLGRSVQRDIFSHILHWLDQYAGVEVTIERPAPPKPRDQWETKFPSPPKSTAGVIDRKESSDDGTDEDEAKKQTIDLISELEEEAEQVPGDMPHIPSR